MAAARSLTGFMHGYRWTMADTAIDITPFRDRLAGLLRGEWRAAADIPWRFTAAYLVRAAVFFSAACLTESPDEGQPLR